MNNLQIAGLIMVTAGCYCIVACLLNSEFFFRDRWWNHRITQIVLARLTRRGARIFYFVLGSIILCFGLYLYFTA